MNALTSSSNYNKSNSMKKKVAKIIPENYIIYGSVTELSETNNSYYMIHINNENICESNLSYITDIVTDIYNCAYKYVTHINEFKLKNTIRLMYLDRLCKFTVCEKKDNHIGFKLKFNVKD